MPNSNDAAKRHRQSLKRRLHNRSVRSRIRTSIKAFEVAIVKKEKVLAQSIFSEFAKLMDSAVGKGIYHQNTGARKKSRLHKRLLFLQQS